MQTFGITFGQITKLTESYSLPSSTSSFLGMLPLEGKGPSIIPIMYKDTLKLIKKQTA